MLNSNLRLKIIRGEFLYRILLFFWVLLILCIDQSEAAKTVRIFSSSTREGGSFSPRNAYDTNFKTRWSSALQDTAWLTIDLGRRQKISGVMLFWEDAYAEDYSISVSRNDKEYRQVYEIRNSDGHSDDIYFKPVKARFLRIDCKRPATQWGYSLWEVKVKEADEYPRIYAGEKTDDATIEKICDGDFLHGWKTTLDAPKTIIIDLGERGAYAGFDLYWVGGSARGEQYTVDVALERDSWIRVYASGLSRKYHTNKAYARRDRIRFNERVIRYVQIRCIPSYTDETVELTECVFKRPDDMLLSPLIEFEKRARASERGYYPTWLLHEQRYWTIVGAPATDNELAVAEDGTVEANFSLVPYVYTKNRLYSAYHDRRQHSLDDGWMPIPKVSWKNSDCPLSIEVASIRENKAHWGIITYSLLNPHEHIMKGILYVTIQPFLIHGPWLYGGLAQLYDLHLDWATLFVNGKPTVFFSEAPKGFQGNTFLSGSLFPLLEKGNLLSMNPQSVHDDNHYASAALSFPFELKPGEKMDLHAYVALSEFSEFPDVDEAAFQKQWKAAVSTWNSTIPTDLYICPNKEMVDVYNTNVSYILTHTDEPCIQAGSRVDQKVRMRDGTLQILALLQAGRFDVVKSFIEWVSLHQRDNGFIPFATSRNMQPDYKEEWNEFDSQGQFVYAVAEYYRFTKDNKFVQRHFSHVEKALRYLIDKRSQRLTREYKKAHDFKKAWYGILPDSNSYEGSFISQHCYWDNIWALQGFIDGAFLARAIGDVDAYKWISAERDEFAVALNRSIKNTCELHSIEYLPACVENKEFDTATAALLYYLPETIVYLPKQVVENTYELFLSDGLLKRTKQSQEEIVSSYDLLSAFAYLQREEKEKIHTMLRFLKQRMVPEGWHLLTEIIFPNVREAQYIGDMPHASISALLSTVIRSLFVWESRETLHLAYGIPDEWFYAAEGVGLRNAPTHYGSVSYHVMPKGSEFIITLQGEYVPMGKIVIHLPQGRYIFDQPVPGATIEKNTIILDEWLDEIKVRMI